MRFFALTVALSSVVAIVAPAAAFAQTPAPAVGSTLTLADAIATAKRSNPLFQTSLNARRVADITVRGANASFLPGISSSLGGSYRAGGQTVVNGITQGASSSTLASSGNISASLNLSAAQFSDRKANLKERDIAETGIASSEQNLRQQVTNQYIAVLQAEATASLQDTLLVTTLAQLNLAKAKLQVGTGIQLDVQQAEVADGRQRVAALDAHNTVDIEKIRLFQLLGVAPVLSTQLQQLTSTELPALTLDQLLQTARKSNPTLENNRAREEQAAYRVTSARRAYIPSFGISTSIGGNALRPTDPNLYINAQKASIPARIASCQRSEEVRLKLNLDNNYANCSSISFGAADEAAIRDSYSGFPFNFTKNPLGFSVGLSLPIFDRFQREAGVQNAIIQRKNAEYTVRSQELQLTTDITVAWLQLTTTRQTVAQNELNVRTARLALTLADQRYQLGLITLVDRITASNAFDQAESARITSVYNFQRAFAALEAAVGQPLR